MAENGKPSRNGLWEMIGIGAGEPGLDLQQLAWKLGISSEYRTPVDNKLVEAILSHADREGRSIEEVAKATDISRVYLQALIYGRRSFDGLPQQKFRNLAATLGISCFSAMILGGILTEEDFSVQEREVAVATVGARPKRLLYVVQRQLDGGAIAPQPGDTENRSVPEH